MNYDLVLRYGDLARRYGDRLVHIELSTACALAMTNGITADEIKFPDRAGYRYFDIPFRINERLGIGEFVAVWR